MKKARTRGARRAPLAAVPVLAMLLAFATWSTATAQVVPDMIDTTLSIGEAIDTGKTVGTPEFPASLDLCLMIDLSGSYFNDLPNIKALDDGIFDTVRAGVTDSRFCVTSFVDYPISPWGGGSDYAYRLDQDFTGDKATWTGAIDGLSTRSGADGPESQYPALYQAATGAGQDVPPPGPSGADIPAGQDPSWGGAGVTRVIAITTDAPFHVPTDSGGTYPGPSRDDTVDALNAASIKVIAIKAPGSGAQMDDIAAATGGSVVTTGSSSEEIGDAIIEGITNLPITVTPVPVGCDPLGVSFVPPSDTVISGDTANFVETIAVPNNPALEGTDVHCVVEFQDDSGASIGDQMIWIHIPDETAPVAACVEGPNPDGHIPAAGQNSPGQNEDGFYTLQAIDRSDPDPQIFLQDLGSGTVFGPFANGTNIKYVQANGGKPSQKPGPGVVDWRIKGNGDAAMWAVDASGNVSSRQVCLVPSPPK